MFATNIKYAKKYNYLDEKFQQAFKFLERTDLCELEEGWLDIAPGVVARVQHYDTLPTEQGRFESHEHHFDIQYVAEGIEDMGVTDVSGLRANTAYDPKDDVTFFERPEVWSRVILREKEYVILAPEDAHMPRCAVGSPSFVKKIVIKIEV